ncbi:MAG: helix-turn-helix domain-containing protein [Bacteroidales bacterium]|nr:helix-turn-helix domain-containing protein [Bacteroidales bacterium]
MHSELGKLLKRLREGEPLRDTAERIGISHTYLRVLEKGYDPRTGKEINPSAETLQKLAIAYNYDYRKLLQIAGYLDNNDIINHTENTDDPTPQEIADVIKKADLQFNGAPLNDEDKEDIIGFIKVVLRRNKKQERERRGQATD